MNFQHRVEVHLPSTLKPSESSMLHLVMPQQYLTNDDLLVSPQVQASKQASDQATEKAVKQVESPPNDLKIGLLQKQTLKRGIYKHVVGQLAREVIDGGKQDSEVPVCFLNVAFANDSFTITVILLEGNKDETSVQKLVLEAIKSAILANLKKNDRVKMAWQKWMEPKGD